MPAAATPNPLDKLREPFPPEVVKWRPGSVTKDGQKAMALAYVDARDVEERLDAAFGPTKWSSRFRVLTDDAVEGTIAVWVDNIGWVEKTDVGYSNDPGPNSKETEPLKAAYSDALKRTAVQWGIGRDLYDTPSFWLPINDRKQFVKTPQWVSGKGWVEPGGTNAQQTATVVADDPAIALVSEPLRRKLMARFSAKKLNAAQAKAAILISANKNSSKDLTVSEAETLIERLDDENFVKSLEVVEAVG